MTKIDVKISDKYKVFVDKNPEIIDELLGEYIEKKQDRNTKKILENSKTDFNLNLQLKSVLWI